MAASYQSKDSLVLANQLSVQEVNLQITDTAILTPVSSTVVINIQEPFARITSALFFDDSAGTVTSLPASARVISGVGSNIVTITLAAAFAASDTLQLKYVVAE